MLATAAAALWLLAAPPAGQAAPVVQQPTGCKDDRGVDRCAAKQQRKMRDLFGVRPIEEHAAAGDQVRRVFYVDGYGRDVVAIEFIRPKGADPMLRVHFPAEGKAARVPPMTAAVDSERWADLLRRSGHFDRALPPRPAVEQGSYGPDAIMICLHSWVFTAEASDPAEGEASPATVRRRTEDACDDGLTEALATELAGMALPLLPPCAVLDRKQHRNEMMMLAACRNLKGDRLAAAAVRNAAHRLPYADGDGDLALLAPLFAHQAVVDWAGETNKDQDAAAFWLRKVKEADARFYFEEMTGETAQRVRLRGLLHRRFGKDDDARFEAAKVDMLWVEDGEGYQIERTIVGPFEALPEN